MFAYEILTEQEAIEERFNLLKEGIYDAIVVASIDKVSSSGNPMLDMTLQVFDANGKSRDVRDFLVFTKAMMWKIIHFSDSAGLLTQYMSGKLCSEVAVGNRVQVKISVEEGGEIPQDKLKGKPVGSKYPDKNKVEDYIKKSDQKPLEQKVEDDPFADDDIAF
ncbi:Protein of unknown function DUF669 [uncultured Caudovirales phage]|uniref:Uncharacterized protein n=1 Tax=uncultured Caudovirales phage TaxID=2100421 RepID=A0A6J5L6I1_9CAUD|nr:Protein of unknown function DUF669 [uncultured Caudovirales phage]